MDRLATFVLLMLVPWLTGMAGGAASRVDSGVQDPIPHSRVLTPDVVAGKKPGSRFSKKDKDVVKQDNAARNEGKTVCENCNAETVPAEQHQKGVTPPQNETHVDHVVPKSKGGTGEPSNGQVLCRDCNIKKSDKDP